MRTTNILRIAFHASLLILLFVLPAFAQQRWERTYGGSGYEEGCSVQQTRDGGYIVTGWTNSFGAGNEDVYLIKTDSLGDTLWMRTYGGGNSDFGYSVQQTQDGGYIISGETYSFGAGYTDVYLIKTDAKGKTVWTRTYGWSDEDRRYSVQQSRNGEYIVAGETYPYGRPDTSYVYLLKLNSHGDTLWARNLGTDAVGYSVQQTQDGGYIIGGTVFTQGGWDNDIYLLKTDSFGYVLWDRSYGGIDLDFGLSVQQTQDKGYIISGSTWSFGSGYNDVYLIKTDSLGDTLWTRVLGAGDNDFGNSVRQTQDNGYVVAGSLGGLPWLLKFDANGDTLWTKTYAGLDSQGGMFNSVQQTYDGGYIVAGWTATWGPGDHEVYLIKTDADGNTGVEEKSKVGSFLKAKLKAVPNPFTSFATVPGHSSDRFALYDISGRRVGVYRGDRIGEGLRAGVYFIRAEGRGEKPVRVVKVR
jgi:hypothetical protein